ncbi:MAG: LytR C-terminal domain-containing protein [Actinomycetota bacterium]
MQPAEQDPNHGSRSDLVRGVLVIITALAIGAFVLTQGLDDNQSQAVAAEDATAEVASASTEADSATSTTVAPVGDDAMVDDTTTTTVAVASGGVDASSTTVTTAPDEVTDDPAPVLAPAEVVTLVLNGAGTKGIAGRGTEVLANAGYEVLAPKNATDNGPTAVYYTASFEAEAAAVAELFELDPVLVVTAIDPANPPFDDLRNAMVVVVIGEDGLISL